MKVMFKYYEANRGWCWVAFYHGQEIASLSGYSRRRDAVRGFKRFVARVRAM